MNGSFGLLKPHYTIENDRVTVARNAWLPPLLLALLAPGIWCLVQAFTRGRFDASMFGIGFPLVMAGAFALVMTPWLLPAKIVVEPRGVTWGGKFYPREAIVLARAQSSLVRTSQYHQHLSWSLVIGLANGKPLLMNLGDRSPRTSTEVLATLERGMQRVLALA